MATKKAPAKPPRPSGTPAPTNNSPQATTAENAEQMAEMKELSSSMLAAARYEEGELEVVFQSGSEESYDGTEKDFQELMSAPSPGKWMWARYQPHPLGSRG